MSFESIFGLIFVLLIFGLVIVFAIRGRNHPSPAFREIPAFAVLRRAVGLAVEAGTRLQVSLGSGGVIGMEIAPALAGLAMLDRIARAASVSDRPPVATSGDGSLAILSQDTLHSAYRSMGVEDQYSRTLGQMAGLTPFAYAAGTLPVIFDQQVSANLLVGHMGSEVALINDAAERKGSMVVAGTDDLPGQSVIYVTAQEPLIGEEVFAGGAYLGAGAAHDASLRTQDLLRGLLIAVILLGALLKFLGLDQVILRIFPGGAP